MRTYETADRIGRLRSTGVGPVAPIAPNDSEDGRAKNRRVELVRQQLGATAIGFWPDHDVRASVILGA